MFSIRQLQESDRKDVLQFLNRFEETSQFLITNMRDNGLHVTSHPNSGNYKAIYSGKNLIGVYCLTKRGNLLIQTSEDFSPEEVIRDCEQDVHQLKGFVGDWSSVNPLFEVYKNKNPDYKPSYFSKEFLYSLELKANESKLLKDSKVRLLSEADFEQWLPLSKSYKKELKVPDDLKDDEIRSGFVTNVQNKVWWGLFEGEQLVSQAALNSRGDRIGQVGGVFTPRNLRKKGLAKRTMLHMLNDCIEIHGHNKSILFTGEEDIPAQKLYESIGYRRIGYFALILS